MQLDPQIRFHFWKGAGLLTPAMVFHLSMETFGSFLFSFSATAEPDLGSKNSKGQREG